MKTYLKRVVLQNYVGAFLLALLVLFFARLAFAQDAEVKYVSLVNLPGFNGDAENRSLPDLINSIYLLSIGLGALLGVIKIALAGVKYSMTDVVPQKASAKNDILGVLLGLLILLMPYIVLNTIYPNLTNLNFIDRIQPVGNGGGNSNSNTATTSEENGGQTSGSYTGGCPLGHTHSISGSAGDAFLQSCMKNGGEAVQANDGMGFWEWWCKDPRPPCPEGVICPDNCSA